MAQSSILGQPRSQPIAGQSICAVALLVILLQVAVWMIRGKWYAITFLYLTTPLVREIGWGAWLIFPQESRGLHQIVTTVLGLPVGLTLFAVGAGMMQFRGRR